LITFWRKKAPSIIINWNQPLSNKDSTRSFPLVICLSFKNKNLRSDPLAQQVYNMIWSNHILLPCFHKKKKKRILIILYCSVCVCVIPKGKTGGFLSFSYLKRERGLMYKFWRISIDAFKLFGIPCRFL
jgi:hypothetical protein